MAIRTALGASRKRVVGQMLAEAMVISALGGILGLGLAQLGVSFFNRAVAETIPFFWMAIRIDPTVLLFSLGLVLAAAVLAGLAPALKATGVNMNEVLKDQAWGTSSLRLGRLSRALVVAEVALSCGLLIVSGLMIKGVIVMTESELNFATQDVFAAEIGLRSEAYPEQSDRLQFYGELVARLQERPGVRSAAITSSPPGLRAGGMRMQPEGAVYDRTQDLPSVRFAVISPEFFETLGVELIDGRGFSSSDDAEGQLVAIVNQRFADRFFPGESPIGRRFRPGDLESDNEWLTIVGVAPNLAMNRRVEQNQEGYYTPYAQNPRRFMALLLRAQGDPLALTPVVRAEIAALDPDLPIYLVNSLSRRIDEYTIPERAFGVLFLTFGAAALLLAVVGLYGLLAFAVRRRTRELGIRVALGAVPGDVLWLTLKGGLVQIAIGLILGIGVAAVLAPGMGDLLYDMNPWDWKVYALIALVLSVTGIAASLIPAARATQVDPVEVLRHE
jgi:predicted permease